MATVTYIKEARQAVSAMKGVIVYCLQEKKLLDDATGQRMVSGIHCDGENAFVEFMATKAVYQKTNGTTFYHYVQSFSPEENTTPQEVHAVAKEFAERAWPGHEILVATHCDAGHLHSHFVVNSVSFEDGRKLRQGPSTLQSLRRLSDEICEAHGLSVLPVYENSGRDLSAREYRAAVKGESWKFKLMADICAAMNRSGSREEFKREMKRRGYQVRWADERKYITFTCPNGMKCRDSKLHEDKFRKENLEYELQYREAYYGRIGGKKCRRHQQYARFEHAGDGTDTGEGLGYHGGLAGERGGLPAESVFAGEAAGDSRADGRSTQSVSGTGADDFPVAGEPGAGIDIADGEPRATGWEKSRKEFERFLGKGLAVGGSHRPGRKTPELENADPHHRGIRAGIGMGGGAVRSAVYALAALSEDEEDPEERRKRIEAQENGEAIGTALGMAAGLLSELK
ncbi:hypothetical protein D5272_12805 [bacterium D16-76]|nr:hypothetical protein [bacterium D16-76]